jgi:hypothetical protein
MGEDMYYSRVGGNYRDSQVTCFSRLGCKGDGKLGLCLEECVCC